MIRVIKMKIYRKAQILGLIVMCGGVLYPMGLASQHIYLFTLYPGLLILCIGYVLEQRSIQSKRKK